MTWDRGRGRPVPSLARSDQAPILLRASNIKVRIGSRTVLSGVDLKAETGRVLGVTGPAGSGKTTLLHVLAGIIGPSEGEVTVNGVSLAGRGRGALTSLGFVPQTFGLADALQRGRERRPASPVDAPSPPRGGRPRRERSCDPRTGQRRWTAGKRSVGRSAAKNCRRPGHRVRATADHCRRAHLRARRRQSGPRLRPVAERGRRWGHCHPVDSRPRSRRRL